MERENFFFVPLFAIKIIMKLVYIFFIRIGMSNKDNLIKKVRISYPGGDTGALIKMLSAVLRVDFLLLRKYIVIVDFTPAHCKSQKLHFFFFNSKFTFEPQFPCSSIRMASKLYVELSKICSFNKQEKQKPHWPNIR